MPQLTKTKNFGVALSVGKPTSFVPHFMVDIDLLVRENVDAMLTLIGPQLYTVKQDMIVFRDQNTFQLFFIHLNEYLNSEFQHPLSGNKVSLLELTVDVFASAFEDSELLRVFLVKSADLTSFLSKQRTYDDVYLDGLNRTVTTDLYELINFHANASKHNYYRIKRLRMKIAKMIGSLSADGDSVVDSLESYMEFVVENKLLYHSSFLIELLGNYFVAMRTLVVDTKKYYSHIRFPEMRLTEHIPATTIFLKLRD